MANRDCDRSVNTLVLNDGYDLKRYSEDRYKLIQNMQLNSRTVRGGVLPPLPSDSAAVIPDKRQRDVIQIYNDDTADDADNDRPRRVGPRGK